MQMQPNEIELANLGQRVPAIKAVRERLGIGLTEAKRLVDEECPLHGPIDLPPPMKKDKPVKMENVPTGECVSVTIRMIGAKENRDGTITLAIPARLISPMEFEILDRLFPSTRHQMYKLLDIEALVSCIVHHD